MKKLFLFALVLTAFLFVACDNLSGGVGTRYNYEIFTVPYDEFDTITKPQATFESIKSYVNILKAASGIEIIGSGSGATRDEVANIVFMNIVIHQVVISNKVEYQAPNENNYLYVARTSPIYKYTVLYAEKQ